MPRLKPNRRDEAIAGFEGLLTQGMKKSRLKRGQLTERMGFSQTRMRTIRDNPLKVTFEEIGRFSDILGIPEEEFHSVLRNVPRK